MGAEVLTVIETPRLILRKFRDDDLDELCLLYADSDIRRYFPEGVLSRAQTKEELDWFLGGGWPEHPELGLWATIYRPTGRFIGRCGLIPWTIDSQQEIEVAYLLAKEFWGQGLGAEAAGALVRHAFMRLQLIRLIALIDRENIDSIRTAEKVGFSFEREVEVEGTKSPTLFVKRQSAVRVISTALQSKDCRRFSFWPEADLLAWIANFCF